MSRPEPVLWQKFFTNIFLPYKIVHLKPLFSFEEIENKKIKAISDLMNGVFQILVTGDSGI